MNDRVRLERLDGGGKEVVVGYIADVHLNRVSCESLPDLHSLRERTNRCEGLRADFVVPLAPEKIIDDRYRVAFARQIQCRSPTAIAIAPQHRNLHVCPPPLS